MQESGAVCTTLPEEGETGRGTGTVGTETTARVHATAGMTETGGTGTEGPGQMPRRPHQVVAPTTGILEEEEGVAIVRPPGAGEAAEASGT